VLILLLAKCWSFGLSLTSFSSVISYQWKVCLQFYIGAGQCWSFRHASCWYDHHDNDSDRHRSTSNLFRFGRSSRLVHVSNIFVTTWWLIRIRFIFSDRFRTAINVYDDMIACVIVEKYCQSSLRKIDNHDDITLTRKIDPIEHQLGVEMKEKLSAGNRNGVVQMEINVCDLWYKRGKYIYKFHVHNFLFGR